MYNNAPKKQKDVNIHLFGIKYAKDILEANLNAKDIIEASDLGHSYKTEVQKGINLSNYVTLKKT